MLVLLKTDSSLSQSHFSEGEMTETKNSSKNMVTNTHISATQLNKCNILSHLFPAFVCVYTSTGDGKGACLTSNILLRIRTSTF